ncbi:uncharacterized protein LOC118434971 [Folsomia candida]|nr:uncharacterized protein LOC118434971 [Folsomia candida]
MSSISDNQYVISTLVELLPNNDPAALPPFRLCEATLADLEQSTSGHDIVLVSEIVFPDDPESSMLHEILNEDVEMTDSLILAQDAMTSPGSITALRLPTTDQEDGKVAQVVLLTVLCTGRPEVDTILLGFCFFISHHVVISERIPLSRHASIFMQALQVEDDNMASYSSIVEKPCSPAHLKIVKSSNPEVPLSEEELQKLENFFASVQFLEVPNPPDKLLSDIGLRHRIANSENVVRPILTKYQISQSRFNTIKTYFTNARLNSTPENLIYSASSAKEVLAHLAVQHNAFLGQIFEASIIKGGVEQCHKTLMDELLVVFNHVVQVGTPSHILSARDELIFTIKTRFADGNDQHQIKRSLASSLIQTSCSNYEDNMTEELSPSLFTLPEVLLGASTMYKPNTISTFKLTHASKFSDKELQILLSELSSELDTREKIILDNNEKLYNAALSQSNETVKFSSQAYSTRLTSSIWQPGQKSIPEDMDTKIEEINKEIINRFEKMNISGPPQFKKNVTKALELEMYDVFTAWHTSYKQFISSMQKERCAENEKLYDATTAEVLTIAATLKNINDIYASQEELVSRYETEYRNISKEKSLMPHEDKIELETNFIYELKNRFLSAATEAIKIRGEQDKLIKTALKTGFKLYVDQLKSAVTREDYILNQEALQDANETCMRNVIDHLLNKTGPIRHPCMKELMTQLKAKIEKFLCQRDTDLRKELQDFNKAMGIAEDKIIADVQTILFSRMDTCTTMLEFESLIETQMRLGKEKVRQGMGGINEKLVTLRLGHFEQSYKLMTTDVKDGFEILLETRAKETETAIRDARAIYDTELKKYAHNLKFQRREDLIDANEKIKTLILRRLASSSKKLLPVQLNEVKFALDLTFKSHKKEFDKNFATDLSLGIDLGTTYTCVAVYQGGEVKIIPSPVGPSIIPSCVRMKDDGSAEKVGVEAKETAFEYVENTVFDAKRILGRKFNDHRTQRAIKSSHINIVNQGGAPKFTIGSNLISPEQISAEVLSEMRRMAEEHLGMQVTKAVITVPAYFGDTQRQATIDAARCAGLDVLAVLPEPIAASVAFRLDECEKPLRHVFIYDLGGGTFDVSLLKITNGEIETLALGGDSYLGGRDFDQNMMKYCVEEFKKKSGIDLMKGIDATSALERRSVKRRLQRIQSVCETKKLHLSALTCDMVNIDVPFLIQDKNEMLHLNVEITREKFNQLNQSLFDETITIVDDCIKSHNFVKHLIDDIVLVGGSTKIPKIREMLSAYFDGATLSHNVNPDEAVAHGAAIHAAILNGQVTQGEKMYTRIQDITPISIGVETRGKKFSRIIPKHTKVPTKLTQVYVTTQHNQTSVTINAYQGENSDTEKNSFLGTFNLSGIPPRPVGKERINVTMEICANGVLNVLAVCESTGEAGTIKITADKLLLTEGQIKDVASVVGSRFGGSRMKRDLRLSSALLA